jgi:quinoprotein glucose dehydrogenase
MKRLFKWVLLLVIICVSAIGYLFLSAKHWTGELHTAAAPDPRLPDAGWPVWGGNSAGHRYSAAGQVTGQNVDRLKPVWVFHTGENGTGYRSQWAHTFQATPVLADDTLYFATAFGRVFGVDARSGAQRWMFDARIDPEANFSEVANRGVAYWKDPEAAFSAPCSRRIFAGTIDARLLALDARTGEPCADFAGGGAADLFAAIREADRGRAYPVTSPPVVIGDTVVLGSGMHDNWAVNLGLGTVWAYDARRGKLLWTWHAIPRRPDADNAPDWIPEQAALTGTANVWAPISADAGLGLVYVATGSASPDYYGGERIGSNRHANSLVALQAATGEVAWSHQLVHHDLWDYDLPAQPVLAEIERDGGRVPVVIQPTKMGLLFTFNRSTGEPFFEIEERRVPASDIEGERSWPTQPFPVAPPALVPQTAVLPDDAWGLTPWDRSACRDLIAGVRSEGIYTPPSLEGTIMLPGNGGGINWGGIAWDEGGQMAVANSMNLPFLVALIRREEFESVRDSGRFPQAEFAPQHGTPYGMRRSALLSPWGIPCVAPPWGTLAAVDMVQGRIAWQVPLGTTRDQTPLPFGLPYGMPGLGGPMVTSTGLVFIGAATDNYIRAFDLSSGAELWRHRLPGGGQATPMTYQLGGRQYIVIAAGGHGKMGTTRSDALVAFALAEE